MNIKVHTRRLLEEISNHAINDKDMSTLRIPLNGLINCINELADIASEIDDVRLNSIMMRMALYEVADPDSENYDPHFVNQYLEDNKDEY